MKQDNLKIRPRRIGRGPKEKISAKPSAKGVILKSEKKENSKSGARNLVKRFSVSRLVSLYGFVRRKLYTIRAAKTYNSKQFWKLSRLVAPAGVEYLNRLRYN